MRATKRTLAAVAGVVALAALPSAAGAASGWTGATPLPDSPSAPYPSIGFDADGTATALWMRASDPRGITSAVQTAGGWSAPSTLAGAFATGRPALSVAADGSAVAVWTDDVTRSIQAASRDVDGVWSTPETVSIDGFPASGPPGLAVDRNGSVTAAWGQGCEVIVSTRPARSSAWSEPRSIFPVDPACTLTTPDYGTIVRAPSVGADRAGNVTVVWRTGTNSLASYRSIKSSIRVGGVTRGWSQPELIALPAGRAHPNTSDTSLVVDVDGRAVVAWGVENAGAEVATRPAGIDAEWDDAVQPLPATRTSFPAVALDAHGRASVVWEVAQDGATPPAVKLATLPAAGTAWSAPETVATLPDAGGSAFSPRVTLDDDGGALVAWSRGDVSPATVEAARRPAGGSWSAVDQLADDAPVRTVVALAGDPLGNATVVWPVAPADAGDPGSDPNAITGLASASYAAEPALRTDWTGRTDPTTNSLHSWVRYLYTFWPSVIPGVPDGAGFVELTDGATWPDPADRYSWRWGQADAWRDVTDGELVIDQLGTLRFAMPSHGIDIRLVNPTLRVAADGRSARLISDGLAGGSMADARAGRTELRPFDDVHVLTLDLDAGGYRAGAAVGRRSWIGAPATVTPDGGRLGLTYVGAPFGRFTFSAPVSVPDREPPRPPVDPPRPPVDPPRPPVEQPRPPVQQPGPPAFRGPALRSADAAKVSRWGIAKVATITCRAGTCTVRAPRSVRVRLGARRYVLQVRAPRTLRAGKRGAVTVHLSRRARRALAGRKVTVRFGYSVTSGAGTLRDTVRATLTVPRAKAGRRRGARRR